MPRRHYREEDIYEKYYWDSEHNAAGNDPELDTSMYQYNEEDEIDLEETGPVDDYVEDLDAEEPELPPMDPKLKRQLTILLAILLVALVAAVAGALSARHQSRSVPWEANGSVTSTAEDPGEGENWVISRNGNASTASVPYEQEGTEAQTAASTQSDSTSRSWYYSSRYYSTTNQTPSTTSGYMTGRSWSAE